MKQDKSLIRLEMWEEIAGILERIDLGECEVIIDVRRLYLNSITISELLESGIQIGDFIAILRTDLKNKPFVFRVVDEIPSSKA